MFKYDLFNEGHELINTAQVTVALINVTSKKPRKPPKFIEEVCTWYLQEQLHAVEFDLLK
jgi:acyl-CoA thioesterase FadM